MCKSVLESLCNDLNEFLTVQFSYRLAPASFSVLNNTIDARRKKFDLYFRFKPSYKPWRENCLVLARIGFKSTRVGHGTALLKFIVSVSDRYSILEIGIEQSNHNSALFAKHYGFSEIYEKHWSISVEKLKARFLSEMY